MDTKKKRVIPTPTCRMGNKKNTTRIAAAFVGWVRDKKGNVTKRTIRSTSPTITTFISGGRKDLNTTPTILEILKIK